MRSVRMKAVAARAAGLAMVALMPLAAVPFPAAAEDEDRGPARLVCTFASGTSVSYEKGAFASTPASTLSFTLANIDLEGQSAELIAGEGTKPVSVRIVRAVNANHFLEVVNEGFLNLTTIYDKDPQTGVYPAVHSRHLGLLGQPVFGQYSGTCKDE